METTLLHATECDYEVEKTWLDRTQYVYSHGDMRVLIEPFAPMSNAYGMIEEALQRFRLSVPDYELVDRRSLDAPTRGSLLIGHRLGGLSRFEVSLFFPVADMAWAFRVASPLGQESLCYETLERFLQTFQPVEAS